LAIAYCNRALCSHAKTTNSASTSCREFTVNLISDWFVEAANFTSGAFDAGTDEVDMSGLTPMPSVRVKLTIYIFHDSASYKGSNISCTTMRPGPQDLGI